MEPLASPVVLVVGFADVAARACVDRLRRAGFDVWRAAHGPSAIMRARAVRPMLIVVSKDLWTGERRALDEAADEVAAHVLAIDSDGDLDRALALA